VPPLLALLLLALPADGAADGGAARGSAPSWVESSAGLVPPTLEGGRTEVEMGDVNGDGLLDLVSVGDHGSPFVNTDQHGVMVWLGDGEGGWSVRMHGDFGYGGVALGDVDGDGLVDVGYGIHHDYSADDLGDQLLEVALGDGSGKSWEPWDDGLATGGESWGMFGTDFADIDNDGDLDVGSVSFGCCAGVHVYLNAGDGTWSHSFGFTGGNSDMHFVFGDVNGDGHADFAVSHAAGTVYLGDGTGAFTLGDGNLPPPDFLGLGGVSLGDVDHDGGDELAFTEDDGGIRVWTWIGPDSWQDLSGALPTSGPWDATQLVDMDRDGHRDLAAFGGGQVDVWAGDGAGGWTWIAGFTTPPPGGFRAFRAGGDADHNGFPDLALVAEEGSFPNERNHLRFFKESSVPESLAIAAVYPLGRERLHAGSVHFVDWISAVPEGTGEVALELSTGGPGGPWTPVAAALADSGRYQWHVPAGTPGTLDAHLRYTLTVGAATAQATTPEPFAIVGSGSPIFEDGFESGDTSAWSSTVP